MLEATMAVETDRSLHEQTYSPIETHRCNKLGPSLWSLSNSSRGVIDFRLNTLSQLTLGHEQIVARLQIHPKLRAVPKISDKPERRMLPTDLFDLQ